MSRPLASIQADIQSVSGEHPGSWTEACGLWNLVRAGSASWLRAEWAVTCVKSTVRSQETWGFILVLLLPR